MTEDELIEQIKLDGIEKYGAVFSCSIDDQQYLYRPITIKESSRIRASSVSSADVEDLVVELAILYPENFDIDSIMAGYVSQLANAIIEDSGLNNLGKINEMLEANRLSYQTDIVKTMISVVITAMPSYSVEQLLELTMEQLAGKVVMAENIITTQQEMAGFEDPTFKLFIRSIDDDSEEYEEEVVEEPRPKPKAQPKPQVKRPEKPSKPSKSEEEVKHGLIQMIIAQNMQSLRANTDLSQFDLKVDELEKMDVDTLRGILGIAKNNDPIAAALAQSEAARRTGG